MATIRNETGSSIKAAKVTIVVRAVFGDSIARLGVDIARTIPPGEYVREIGEWSILYEDKARNAITGPDADTSKLSFSLTPKLILFEDGSRFEQ